MKGVDLLLRAFARAGVALDDWQLIVAGPEAYPGYADKLRKLVASLQLDGRVRFVGPVYGQEKADAFASADLFVLPTRCDSFGLVIAEALSAGVPVITTEQAHPWKCLQDQGCGWWVRRCLPAIVSAWTEAAAMSREELETMGTNGQELVRGRFLWRHAAEKSLALYKWLLGQDERPDFVWID